ncbi:hypothetical protein B0H16DRAFT_1707735 [Mycena metata]|uniref:Uncharacterized protein n=1 Tax=Mycena metata TaxID=1033252 RepID=A0AAD7DEG7_9AGAR|nr:hypothetical protein B0H16DRAFT_1707735 [Mycena metata]
MATGKARAQGEKDEGSGRVGREKEEGPIISSAILPSPSHRQRSHRNEGGGGGNGKEVDRLSGAELTRAFNSSAKPKKPKKSRKSTSPQGGGGGGGCITAEGPYKEQAGRNKKGQKYHGFRQKTTGRANALSAYLTTSTFLGITDSEVARMASKEGEGSPRSRGILCMLRWSFIHALSASREKVHTRAQDSSRDGHV